MEEPRGRYADEAAVLLREHNVTVRKWRKTNSGIAYNGCREIECPHPRDVTRLAVVAHEIGHHVLGHTETKWATVPRWKEELDAWMWSNQALLGIGIKPDYEQVTQSLRYCFRKAVKRGMLHIPEELRPYLSRTLIEWAEDEMQPKPYGVAKDDTVVWVLAHNHGEAKRLVG